MMRNAYRLRGRFAAHQTFDVPEELAGALTGNYEVRCIEAGATPRFLVTGPDGQPVGVAEAGAVSRPS